MAKLGTLHEVETQWTLEDLLNANEALDIEEEQKRWAEEQIEKKRKSKGA